MNSRDWLYALLLIVATALTRATLVVLGHRVRIAPRIGDALRFAPACALSAILVPSLLTTSQGQPIGWSGSAPLWASLTAALVMIGTRSMVAALVAGMAVFWGLRALGVPV